MIDKTKSMQVASMLSAIIAIACFVLSLILSIYLEETRPISPDPTQEFVNYMKFIGKPFYVSSAELNAVHLLSLSYITFALLALLLRARWLKK
jgi:hypothetical protein